MVAPLLETKLHVPRVRPGLVRRPRLVEALRRGSGVRLRLVSAPAGSGKTTLLAEWLAGNDTAATAWLSLDPGDNDSATFWTYLVAALLKVAGVETAASDILREGHPVIGSVLPTLINDLSGITDPVSLVLDDYHLIESPGVQSEVGFFLDHLPEQVRLVIATRSDPALPLARLRARGELVEIRAADLRFTSDEAGSYLDEMGLELTGKELAVLEERTEGWVAAMQLAALSMQNREDVSDFIAGFAGSDRYVVDYLVEEVLQSQPSEVRAFLLQTSILATLTGALCDAVTDGTGGRAMLERLDRANLFTVPLDDRREWYRYHHLFADVLHARLLDESPGLPLELHRRASAWWEENGDQAAAIRHALAGEDFDRAADMVELALPDLRRRRQEQTMREWLDALPDELYETRPVLAIGSVGSRLVSGVLEGVEARLRQAERWVDAEGSTEMVVRDGDSFRRLPAAIAVYRAALAHAGGDTGETIAQSRHALELIDPDDHLERGSAAGLLALALWSRGELDDSFHWWSEAALSLEKAGHISDSVACRIALADIAIEKGLLDEAGRLYEQGLDLASAHSTTPIRGVADMHIGLADLQRERNHLDAAREHLQKSDELGAGAELAQNAYRSKVVRARLSESEGDFDSALELLNDAEKQYTSDYFPEVRPISAMRARMWIRQGRTREAEAWARRQGLSPRDEPSYLREYEHITLAELLLKSDDPAADRFLETLITEAERGGRTRNVIETLVLQALARSKDSESAVATLERAVALAEPQGFVRVFADHGHWITPLIEKLAGRSSGYARRLLRTINADTPTTPAQRLVDPLTEREFEVLRLLNTDLPGPEIARQLFVSLNTLRTHTKSIYLKLGANNRRTAVRRARELDLLPS